MSAASDTEARLQQMATLSQNWDSYGANPPRPEAMAGIRFLLQAIAPFMAHAAELSPSTEGFVAAEWFHGAGGTLIIEAESETRFSYYSSDGHHRECEGVFEIVAIP